MRNPYRSFGLSIAESILRSPGVVSPKQYDQLLDAAGRCVHGCSVWRCEFVGPEVDMSSPFTFFLGVSR
jgi:hypothetical protein